jgi:hypothetical protein
VYARVATFQGDPANIDEAISMVLGQVESGDAPPGLEGAKRDEALDVYESSR